MKLSILILTKNENEMIEDCLRSVAFGNEIIIIDSRSTDQTRETAQKYTDKIFTIEWSNFAEARNDAREKAHSEWILYLDADERITPKLQEEIVKIINSESKFNGYFINRDNFYLGKKWPTQDKVQRLFKKDKLIKWYGELHETPEIKGEFGTLENPLVHFTHRNLSQMLEKTIVWSDIEAKLRFNVNHPKVTWWRLLRVMTTEFYNYYIKQKGFKAGVIGLIESFYQSFSIFITYVKLYELQTKGKIS
jgi:glycosyltransferase involved in cell wall biosynthesis